MLYLPNLYRSQQTDIYGEGEEDKRDISYPKPTKKAQIKHLIHIFRTMEYVLSKCTSKAVPESKSAVFRGADFFLLFFVFLKLIVTLNLFLVKLFRAESLKSNFFERSGEAPKRAGSRIWEPFPVLEPNFGNYS